jgi:hypothetical protein
MGPEEPDAGSAALVVGSRHDRLTFCLDRLATAERTAAVVLPPDPGTVIEEYERLGGEAPLTVVIDESADTIPTDGAGVHTTTVDAGSLPSVGEAALGTIETDGADPPADRLWIAGLPDLLEGSSVQQVYRLLYILSEHVRRVDGLGLYGLSESTEPKTVRILRQALDYEITLEPGSDPETRALAEPSTGV